MRRALTWLVRYGDPNGDGFIEYLDVPVEASPTRVGRTRDVRPIPRRVDRDATDRALRSAGVRASGRAGRRRTAGSVRHTDSATEGRTRPVRRDDARFDDPDRWRDYAADLADAFRERFWVSGPLGAYPALALDGDGRPVDSLTSNIGHLLGTGLLSPVEETTVARLLAAPALSGGYGLRTMSTLDAAYDPLSYHCGSIWPHDTAIALLGLASMAPDRDARAAGLISRTVCSPRPRRSTTGCPSSIAATPATRSGDRCRIRRPAGRRPGRRRPRSPCCRRSWVCGGRAGRSSVGDADGGNPDAGARPAPR